MNFSLIMLGAHDGSKTNSFIRERAALGSVLLVEPVPFLFARLSQRFAGVANITCLNEAVSNVNGEVDFYMPAPDVNDVASYGDQLGSLIAGHAESHDAAFGEKIRKVKCKSRTMYSLLADFDVRAIDVLWTDMEGYDAACLMSFPFYLLKPTKIFSRRRIRTACSGWPQVCDAAATARRAAVPRQNTRFRKLPGDLFALVTAASRHCRGGRRTR